MRIKLPYPELAMISKALGTVLGSSSKNPITNYLVFSINADTGKASVRCTNLDVIMSKSLSGVEVNGKGNLDFVPVEGKRFLSLLKHSDEVPIRMKLDAKEKIAEYACGRLKSKIRLGYQDMSLFPTFDDTSPNGLLGAMAFKQAMEFVQKLVGSDSFPIIENTPYGLCAGSQSRFGVFNHEEMAGMPLSIPTVVLKPLMAYLGLLEDDLLQVESKEGFVVLRHQDDPDDYIAFRRSLDNLPDLSETIIYPVEACKDEIRIETGEFDRVIKRVAVALEPGENRMQFGATSANTAGLIVSASGSNGREAAEAIEMVRKADGDTVFTTNYSHMLGALGMLKLDDVVIRVADNFIKLVEKGEDYEMQVIMSVFGRDTSKQVEPEVVEEPEDDEDYEDELDDEMDEEEYEDDDELEEEEEFDQEDIE